MGIRLSDFEMISRYGLDCDGTIFEILASCKDVDRFDLTVQNVWQSRDRREKLLRSGIFPLQNRFRNAKAVLIGAII